MTPFTLYLFLVVIAILGGTIWLDVKRHPRKYKLGNSVVAYLFLLPALLLVVTFVFQPILMSIWYGFTDYYLLTPDDIDYVGLENFQNISQQFQNNGDVYNALKNTIQFMVLVVPLQVISALILALILNQKRRGNTIYKVAFFAPVVMSLTVISILWLFILRPDDQGLMNNLLALVDIEPQTFLRNPKQAMYMIVLISAWQGLGFQMLIFSSGLKNIPYEYYEAARIDGANGWDTFRHITLPSLKPITIFILLTTFIASSKLMIQPMVMTGFKPYTVTLSYLIYLEGYVFRSVGSASALALLVTIFIASLILIQRRILREEEV